MGVANGYIRSRVELQTPVGGDNLYGFKVGDPCWFEGAEGDDGLPVDRTRAELLGTGEKPVIRIDEPATQSLCTQWGRLQPLVCRGARCWYVVERGIERGGVRKNRRVLAELQKAQPVPSVRPINSEDSRTVSWSDLEPLNQADVEAMQQLEPISEAKLAQVLATAAEKGCALGEVRWKRQRNGELSGERKADAQRRARSPKKVVRSGKRCGTPGCTFLDHHDGLCSHEHDLAPRRRAAVAQTPPTAAHAPSRRAAAKGAKGR